MDGRGRSQGLYGCSVGDKYLEDHTEIGNSLTGDPTDLTKTELLLEMMRVLEATVLFTHPLPYPWWSSS